jgi:hypothetical protein
MRIPLLVAFAVTLLVAQSAGDRANAPVLEQGTAYYAAPFGRRAAPGTIDDPLDLATALSRRGPVGPGDTVWLLAGRYLGSYTSTVQGTALQPIVVRGQTPWATTIDAQGAESSPLIIRGAWTVFRDFDVMNSDPRRAVSTEGSRAVDGWRRDGVVVYGPHTRLINLTVHDNADGIALWGPARGAEVYGCIVYNNGWIGPDRGHGHGLYIQSAEDSKLVRDVVSFNNFATGMKAYAERGRVDGVQFDGVVSFNNGSPAAAGGSGRMPNLFVGPTSTPAGSVSVTDSFLYQPAGTITQLGGNLALGFTATGNARAVVRRSVIAGGHRALFLRDWRATIVEGNTMTTSGEGSGSEHPRLAAFESSDQGDPGGPLWDHNRYLALGADAEDAGMRPLFATGGRRLDFDGWREVTGFDGSSTYAAAAPDDADVFVRPNRYERGRAHIVIFNWSGLESVVVDLSATGLRPGEPFEIRDVQNLGGAPAISSTYDGSAVRLSFTDLRAASPIGGAAQAHTAPGFAVFLVLPVFRDAVAR